MGAKRGILAGLLGLCMATIAGAVEQGGTITVVQGQTRVVTAPDVKRVAVGNGNLVEVKAFRDTDQILLIGNKTGTTDLRTWSFDGVQKQYMVRVSSGRPRISVEDVETLLQGTRGLSVGRLGSGDILITGSAKRVKDFSLVQGIAKRYPSVISQVAKPKVSLKATVLVKARVLEVQRNTMKELGIDWSDALNGPTFAFLKDFVSNTPVRPPVEGGLGLNLPLGAGTQSYFGINTRVDSVIDIMAGSDNARLLAEPEVSVVSGRKAKFHVGGEVPIPVVSGDGSTDVVYKEYGIILDIQPVADRQGFIETKVKVEVSSLDRSVTVRGVPGFRTRRTETEMNGRDGQTLVISGLLSAEDAKNVDKVPGLGDVPVIGELFKSREFQRKRTELVVMLTPELTSPGAPANEQRLQQARKLDETARKATQFSIFD